MKKVSLVCVVMFSAFVFIYPFAVSAKEENKPADSSMEMKGTQVSELDEKVGWAGDKFTRGLTNIATGWLEIPVKMGENGSKKGMLSGMTAGFGEGIVTAIIRTGAGVWDTATFPGVLIIPDEKPVIDPPTLFEK